MHRGGTAFLSLARTLNRTSPAALRRSLHLKKLTHPRARYESLTRSSQFLPASPQRRLAVRTFASGVSGEDKFW